ncbi:hypothetical protein G7K_1503-t1 [Saitoella complicata NRRL Y-17804]|uniref:Uncharacterized protein n=1 Tax=Saitoella complicata (strain BCRC 22490 / CBS 7301 / JCM 7358 / NBRC 10748 / NRRL Y-17804) TaxID=698492 RepID=A0A0E9NBS9_SAICN|nr:hypothetical protein G7K_1503-t1 [Saitoella complicata NRRL Y-17804]
MKFNLGTNSAELILGDPGYVDMGKDGVTDGHGCVGEDGRRAELICSFRSSESVFTRVLPLDAGHAPNLQAGRQTGPGRNSGGLNSQKGQQPHLTVGNLTPHTRPSTTTTNQHKHFSGQTGRRRREINIYRYQLDRLFE